MANTIMKIPIRNMVSRSRKRYTKDGFNLDLSYILPNLIAMGFPAERLESFYRNDIDEVCKFLEKKHKDYYKVYNLCSERSYDITKFHDRVASYPFDDHNPPNIELIQKFCEDVGSWLNANELNVAAVHCKAGKGRTGKHNTSADALNYYAQKRTYDEKGVTIPSQRRYVEYYARLLGSGKSYSPVPLQICELILSPLPLLNNHQGTGHYGISYVSDGKEYKVFTSDFKKTYNSDGNLVITLDRCIALAGDVKVEFFTKNIITKEKLFHFWFNTFFVSDEADNNSASESDNPNIIYKLFRQDLDVAHKVKQNKNYPPDFQVNVILQRTPAGSYAHGADQHLHNNVSLNSYPNIHTPSESPEASSSESSTGEDWESDTKSTKDCKIHYSKTSKDDVVSQLMMDSNRRMSHLPLSEGVLSLFAKNFRGRRRRRDST